ncbi:MAG: xanthine dehydrogenase family protein molybdopterin-binding subunit [Burkholderiaceae bacterium]|nr:xanthine dehydrogenase family protein molybdopterin-binding subunit [Burkholderiaceae bacterium]
MKRRHFLLSALGVGAGLVVGWGLLPPRDRLGDRSVLDDASDGFALNGWIRIDADGGVALAMPRAEMGQGVHTALPMLLAEELAHPLDRIRILEAPSHRIYANVAMLHGFLPIHPRDLEPGQWPMGVKLAEWLTAKLGRELGLIATGGSTSVADAWEPVRLAGAHARDALREAAARHWRVPVGTVALEAGILRAPGGLQAGIAAFAARAAVLPDIVAEPRARAQWRIIGRSAPRTDLPAKVDGTAVFGTDVRLPGMRFAAVALSPTLGGRLGSLDVDSILEQPGVERVVRLSGNFGSAEGFAVIARSGWEAQRAVAHAKARWLAEGERPPSSRAHRDRLIATLDETDGFAFHRRGSVSDAFGGGSPVISATYEAPHLAHMTMEPMNATARVNAGRVEVWAPAQSADLVRLAAARVAGVGLDDVTVHTTLLGGGFGRRLEVDYVAQAVRVAMEADGAPVQLVWSRETDTTHDFYRPAQVARLEAALDERRRPRGLRVLSAGDSILRQLSRRLFPAVRGTLPDRTDAEGLFDQPYDIPHQRIAHAIVESDIPIGFWRSVGHSHNAFFIECFIDELAAAAGADPLEYRLELLAPATRHRRVLETAAARAGWGSDPAPGRARGLALHESFGTIVAMVVEVSALDQRPRLHHVVCAIDCGTVVNPGIVAQQVEGSVVFGLTAALHGRIDIVDGRVAQSNFPDQPALRMAQAPHVETLIVPSERPPAGVGEPVVPVVAPALGNAWFTLTGRRFRSLPFPRA